MCPQILFYLPISPEDTLEKGKIFFAMISTGSIKVPKKRRKYNGHFCSAPGCSNSYGKTNVQELKEAIILSQWRTGKDYRHG